ncbi:MAG: tRNA (adenosine(37)-N6)-threonylcarbamoyltransferase complex dimerization subunit type 1 TsaB [Clostridia bacterium]|nr:tRNA (adenosine(37)-N6)-threonylcarbamoyltransferase complex dimerization subunit type 1 TsaB [Clostridia bacterium]MBQ9966115.1 tRNA (adenosine(37)-N6)-threonylcarbamoyltransferase complex dimerization subunit type 1 TsaB [Clostridia bacterium]
MRLLAIDTSGRIASCSLYEDGVEIASCVKDSNLDHSRTILPLCQDMLKEKGLEFKDIDAFAASVGPGSFTGIRIGVAAVKGFALAGNKPAAGISSLESAAVMVEDHSLICSLIRAREDEYFYGFFRNSKDGFFRICADNVLTGSEIKGLLYGANWVLCGDGAEDFLRLHPHKEEHVRNTGVVQSASGVAKCAWELAQYDELVDGNDIVPVYLKKTQAERMREEKNK